MSKTYSLKQIENMHGHWFILLGNKNMHFKAMHYISSFTYIFANIHKAPQWVQFEECSLDLMIYRSFTWYFEIVLMDSLFN